jgi:hypothetical protein
MPNNYGAFGNPDLPSAQQFSGWRGFRDALDTYMNQVSGPEKNAAGDLAASQSADAVGGAYQDQSGLAGDYGAGGRKNDRGLGMFSGLMSGIDQSRVSGGAATDLARAQALGGMGHVYDSVANNIYNIRSARERESAAKTQVEMEELQALTGLAGPAGSLAGSVAGLAGNKGSASVPAGGVTDINPTYDVGAENSWANYLAGSGAGATGSTAVAPAAGATATAGEDVTATGSPGLWSSLMGLFS